VIIDEPMPEPIVLHARAFDVNVNERVNMTKGLHLQRTYSASSGDMAIKRKSAVQCHA